MARRCLPSRPIPNSVACLIEAVVSAPAFASAITFAPELCACSSADEKSAVFRGRRVVPTTLPPVVVITRVASSSNCLPNA